MQIGIIIEPKVVVARPNRKGRQYDFLAVVGNNQFVFVAIKGLKIHQIGGAVIFHLIVTGTEFLNVR